MALLSINITNGLHKSSAFPAPVTTTMAGHITTAIAAAGSSHDSTTELTTIQTDMTALATAAPTIDGDVSVTIDLAKVTTRNKLKAALEQVFFQAQSAVGE